MVQQNYQEETTNPTTHSEMGVHQKGENFSGESQGEREEFQLEETKDDEEIHKDFGGQELEKIFIHRHHVEPRSSILRAEKRIISYSTEFFWCH